MTPEFSYELSGQEETVESFRARWHPNPDAAGIVLDFLKETSGPSKSDEAEFISQVNAAIDYLDRQQWPEAVRFEHQRGRDPVIDIRGADFSDMDLPCVNFTKALLGGVKFFRTELSFADFSGRDLTDVQFVDSSGSEISFLRTHGSRCSFRGVNFIRADFADSTYRDSDFSTAVLRRSSMLNATFERCSLRGVDVSRAKGCRAKLINCQLEAALFSGADLTEAEFVNSNLSYACFRAAILVSSKISNIDLSGADFRRANLTSLKWYKPVIVDRTHISGASFPNSREFERYVRDEQWLQEFGVRAAEKWYLRFWAFAWRVSSDYGRSMFRMAFWVVALIATFAVIFHLVNHGGLFPGPSIFAVPPPQRKAVEIGFTGDHLGPLWESFHLSIDLFTTMGVSRVEPKTQLGALLVWGETFIGWITLGSFLSVLANVFARRS